MNKLTLSQISAAVDAAFAATLALPAPVKVPVANLGDNATLRTDVYTGKRGSGFAVTAVMDLGWRKLVICKQHGPEVFREQPAPTLASLKAECLDMRAKSYPPMQDYLDAIVKQSDTDPAIVAIGAAQEATYKADCLAVKAKYPKPE